MQGHREYYRRHLPHWQPAGATLFITFRLAGSLPRAVVAALQEEREQAERALSHIAHDQKRADQAYRDARRAFGQWDAALHNSAAGPRWLGRPQVAAIVSDALHYRDEQVYDMLAFCIMPNHVHLVCTPLQGENGSYHALHRILQSLKRHTARRANELLGRQGAFWHGESYDHGVRSAEELARIIRYVVDNPVKAGLVCDWRAWPWTHVRS